MDEMAPEVCDRGSADFSFLWSAAVPSHLVIRQLERSRLPSLINIVRAAIGRPFLSAVTHVSPILSALGWKWLTSIVQMVLRT